MSATERTAARMSTTQSNWLAAARVRDFAEFAGAGRALRCVLATGSRHRAATTPRLLAVPGARNVPHANRVRPRARSMYDAALGRDRRARPLATWARAAEARRDR